MNNDPRTREAQHNMNTSIIGRVLPTIIEDYGHNRNMDIIVSLSHSLVKDKLTNAKVSGFQVDRNGNFKIIGNVAMDMLIEKDQNRGNYEQARECYFRNSASPLRARPLSKKSRRMRSWYYSKLQLLPKAGHGRPRRSPTSPRSSFTTHQGI